MSDFLKKVVKSQVWLSRRFDRILPAVYRVDGSKDFRDNIVPPYIVEGATIYDIGGGSQPYLSIDQKERLSLRIIGLDISQEELDAAPDGIYDRMICADLSQYSEGDADADVIVCHAVMEHVKDTDGAFQALSSFLKPGGYALLFMPSRNALFARLNLLLPESWKRKILFSLFPSKAEGHDGFPAFYDECTPAGHQRLAQKHGLDIVEIKAYYTSSYFSICAPIYVIWRLWLLVFKMFFGKNAAETFTLVVRRPLS